ncbi:anhydro-N-acetylmuramic acid kinase [uncultured Halopseudomonas sp.]|uniref:anhydro-N-acetylmuramic acid kinase n=1 Tax=uncultured Halopseudomonas sp. TaxID=2901193 RepID=UPI0030EC6D1A
MANLYVGIMSGTSLDGIDVALVELSTPQQAKLIDACCIPFPQSVYEELLALCAPGADEVRRAGLAGQNWARLAATGVNQLLERNALLPSQVMAIGSHGQTIRHHPELGFSTQIGAPALLAELTNISVVSDFRSRDLAAGGEGAPLVPAFHEWLLRSPDQARTLINIGGFANLTVLDPEQPVVGFDSGPGNVLMDHWIQLHRSLPYDNGGSWARSGKVSAELLELMLNDPYFQRQGPKSTGREYFHPAWLDNKLATLRTTLPPEDAQATLLELTAHTISLAVRSNATNTKSIFVCGGGARNQYLLERLESLLRPIPVGTTAQLGVDPDWMEAIAFAWLAWRCLERQPGNQPQVTGASGLRILGAHYPA